MEKDTLYYDGACPLCRAEVGKLARFSKNQLNLADIHQLPDAEGTPGREKLLARLHLRTAEGEWLTGLNANIYAWRHTPFRHVWQVLGWPFVRPISEWCYEFWLRQRSRRKSCR